MATIIEKMTYSKALTFAIENGVEFPDEVIEKLEALKASIEKKNSTERKPTKTQTANEGIKGAILEGLSGAKTPLTIGEMIKTIPELAELSSQKVSSLVRQMVESGALTRTEDKRKAYFSVPADEQ